MAKTLTQLNAQANQIKNETGTAQNTANRVGGLFGDIVDYLGILDNDGYEYIYKVTDTTDVSTPPSSGPGTAKGVEKSNWSAAEVAATDDWVPQGWSDGPEDIDALHPYQYVSVRKRDNGGWGAFSKPVLWARYTDRGATGSHYEFRYRNYIPTEQAPTPPVPAAGTNGLTDGWARIQSSPNIANGEWTYTTNCLATPLDGGGLSYGTWESPAMRITGENGKNGEDGNSIEYVYLLYFDDNIPSSSELRNLAPVDWETNADYQRSDYLPTGTWTDTDSTVHGWTDNPSGITEVLPYEYVAVRERKNGVWQPFVGPTIWSKWGDRGEDGDGYEYIFKHFESPQTFGNNNSNPHHWDAVQGDEYLGPTGHEWSDNPVGVTENYLYEYVSTRKRNGGSWGLFTTPKLWAHWADKGANGGHYIFMYKNFQTQPATPVEGTTQTDMEQAGWSTQATTPDFEHGYYTWMTQCLVSDTGEYGVWTVPTRITGDNGEDGEDGDGFEFIYTRNNTGVAPAAPPTTQTDDWHGYDANTGYTWTDNPVGVEIGMMYEYVTTRKRVNGVWQPYSTPAVWSKWGEKGMDGDGYEYIYKTFPEEQVWSKTAGNYTNPENWPVTDSPEYYGPYDPEGEDPTDYRWSDDPQPLDNDQHMYQYVAVRRRVNGHWGAYSEPVVWSSWAMSGTSPWVADLDNEMDSVSCDVNGHPDSVQLLETTVSLYYGSNPKSFTVGVYSNKECTSSYENRKIIPASGVAVEWRSTAGNSNTIKVRVNGDLTINGKMIFYIKLTNVDDPNVFRVLQFVVNGIRPGANGDAPVLYNLNPNQTQISAIRNGDALVPATFAGLKCGYKTNDKGTVVSYEDATEVFGPLDAYSVFFRRRQRGGNWEDTYYIYSGSSVNRNMLATSALATYDSIEFIICTALQPTISAAILERDYEVIDRETVPVVVDGNNGNNGTDVPYLELSRIALFYDADSNGVSTSAQSFTVNFSLRSGSETCEVLDAADVEVTPPSGVTCTNRTTDSFQLNVASGAQPKGVVTVHVVGTLSDNTTEVGAWGYINIEPNKAGAQGPSGEGFVVEVSPSYVIFEETYDSSTGNVTLPLLSIKPTIKILENNVTQYIGWDRTSTMSSNCNVDISGGSLNKSIVVTFTSIASGANRASITIPVRTTDSEGAADNRFSTTVTIPVYINRKGTFTREIIAGVENVFGEQTVFTPDKLGRVIKTKYEAAIETSAQGFEQKFSRIVGTNLLPGLNRSGAPMWIMSGTYDLSQYFFSDSSGHDFYSPWMWLEPGNYTLSLYGNPAQSLLYTTDITVAPDTGQSSGIGFISGGTTGESVTIDGTVYERRYYTFTIFTPRYYSINFTNSNFARPQVEKGTSPTDFTADSIGSMISSVIRQSAAKIEVKVKNTGIDITEGLIKATAGNFEICNSSGTPTFSIDSNGNIIASGNAKFQGSITATGGEITGMLTVGTTSGGNFMRINPNSNGAYFEGWGSGGYRTIVLGFSQESTVFGPFRNDGFLSIGSALFTKGYCGVGDESHVFEGGTTLSGNFARMRAYSDNVGLTLKRQTKVFSINMDGSYAVIDGSCIPSETAVSSYDSGTIYYDGNYHLRIKP